MRDTFKEIPKKHLAIQSPKLFVSETMKSISSLPRTALILGLAFVGLLAMREQAQAGESEILAIANKLPGGATTDVETAKTRIGAANTTDLSNATIAAIGDTANIELDPSIIAGEALKGAGAGAVGIGTQLATAVLANLNNTNGTFPKILSNVQSFTGNAAEIAATGTAKNDFAANPTNIPDFAAVIITRVGVAPANYNTEALLIAGFATKSTTAIGAILGGRTLNADLDTAQERIDLAKQGIADKKLTKASQQIAEYVGADGVDDAEAAAFALAVVKGNNNAGSTKDNNTKFIVQIATGTSTSTPSAAAGVVNALFDGITGTTPLTVPTASISPFFTATVKNSTKLASNVSFVADAEQVQGIAVTLGARIGLTNQEPGSTKVKVVGIAQSKVSAIAKALVLGLTTRPTIRTTDPTPDATQMVRNSRANRVDEIGEIGAYMLNAIKGLPVFQVDSKANRKDAPSLVISLLKTIITGSKKVFSDAAFAINGGNAKEAVVKDAVFQAGVADDASGSIGLTLNSLNAMGMINPQIHNAIAAKLQTSSNSVAGKTLGPTILAALNAGLTNGMNGAFQASVIYEDGTIAGNAFEGITGAETDKRNR